MGFWDDDDYALGIDGTGNVNTPSDFVAGNVKHLTIVYTPGTGGVLYDGTKLVVTVNDPGTSTTGNLYIGTRNGGTAYSNAIIYAAYAWDKIISQDELNWIVREPYALFHQVKRSRYFTVGAGQALPPLAMHQYRQRRI